MTWRPSDELLARVRRAAGHTGRSVNDYVNAVLDAATDPDLAETDMERLRGRLDRAGLLASPITPHRRPAHARVAQARAAAGGGVSLADLVSDGR